MNVLWHAPKDNFYFFKAGKAVRLTPEEADTVRT